MPANGILVWCDRPTQWCTIERDRLKIRPSRPASAVGAIVTTIAKPRTIFFNSFIFRSYLCCLSRNKRRPLKNKRRALSLLLLLQTTAEGPVTSQRTSVHGATSTLLPIDSTSTNRGCATTAAAADTIGTQEGALFRHCPAIPIAISNANIVSFIT
tara:strand:- start:3781 stop:4248 length:468 start_codon:yes stop_codon:yes gene_type:complete